MSTKTKATTTPKGETVTREVTLDLTDERKLQLFDEMAEKMTAEEKLKADFADVKTKWNDRIKPVTDRITAIRSYVKDGKETKTLKVTAVKNWDQDVVEYWWDNKVVDSRPMNPEDRQEKLNIKKGRAKENSVTKPAKRDGRMAAAGDREDNEIDEVRKAETGRKTKRSAVDGPTPEAKATGVYE